MGNVRKQAGLWAATLVFALVAGAAAHAQGFRTVDCAATRIDITFPGLKASRCLAGEVANAGLSGASERVSRVYASGGAGRIVIAERREQLTGDIVYLWPSEAQMRLSLSEIRPIAEGNAAWSALETVDGAAIVQAKVDWPGLGSRICVHAVRLQRPGHYSAYDLRLMLSIVFCESGQVFLPTYALQQIVAGITARE